MFNSLSKDARGYLEELLDHLMEITLVLTQLEDSLKVSVLVEYVDFAWQQVMMHKAR